MIKTLLILCMLSPPSITEIEPKKSLHIPVLNGGSYDYEINVKHQRRIKDDIAEVLKEVNDFLVKSKISDRLKRNTLAYRLLKERLPDLEVRLISYNAIDVVIEIEIDKNWKYYLGALTDDRLYNAFRYEAIIPMRDLRSSN